MYHAPPTSAVERHCPSHESVNHLGRLLQEDLEAFGEGQRLILPFLGTEDRLRLSETSRVFKHYRYHLTAVKVVVPPKVAAEGSMFNHVEGVVLMLAEQRLGITHLSAGGGVALAMLVAECVSTGLFPDLEILDLSSSYMMDEEGDAVVDALSGGYCRGLKELYLCVDTKGMGGVASALSKGACPLLRKLSNQNAAMGVDAAQALSIMFQTGAVPRLQGLSLRMTNLGNEGLKAIATALQSGECRDLRVLDLAACDVGAEGAMYVTELLKSRSCPKLDTLLLSSNPKMGDDGASHLSGAIGSSCCPALKRLELQEIGMGPTGGRSLAQALQSSPSTKAPACPNLEHLAVGFNNSLGDETVAEIVSALRGQGRYGNLRHLMLTATGIAEKAGLALVQAIVDGSFARLTCLGLQTQELDGLLQTAEMVGACAARRRLKNLMVAEMDRDKEGSVSFRSVHNKLKRVEEGFREIVAWGTSGR